MPNKTTIILGLFAIVVGIVGAAVKLGGFTDVTIAWSLIGLACVIALFATWLWIQPIYKRMIIRSPLRILPAHFASEHRYTVATLDAEFAQFREAFKDVEYFFQMLRMICEYNESPVRDEMSVMPHEYNKERTAADKYRVAKQNLWDRLNELTEIYRRLT